MIKEIIDLLQKDKLYGVSKSIDIAKGKWAYPNNWKELVNVWKRNLRG